MHVALLTHLQARSAQSAHDFVLLPLRQEACSGPLRDAARTQGAAFAELRAEDLRPVVLKDFKVQLPDPSRARSLMKGCWRWRQSAEYCWPHAAAAPQQR